MLSLPPSYYFTIIFSNSEPMHLNNNLIIFAIRTVEASSHRKIPHIHSHPSPRPASCWQGATKTLCLTINHIFQRLPRHRSSLLLLNSDKHLGQQTILLGFGSKNTEHIYSQSSPRGLCANGFAPRSLPTFPQLGQWPASPHVGRPRISLLTDWLQAASNLLAGSTGADSADPIDPHGQLTTRGRWGEKKIDPDQT